MSSTTIRQHQAAGKVAGDDWASLSIGDQAFLTDPAPVREVYPEQYGGGPYGLGYGSLEPHCISSRAPPPRMICHSCGQISERAGADQAGPREQHGQIRSVADTAPASHISYGG